MISVPTQDSQAILLLCAKLGPPGDSAQPLTAKQYAALAKWLHDHSLRPGSLLHNDGRAQLADLQLKGVGKDQVERLLDRGPMLGLMVERWIRSGIWIITREDDEYPARYQTNLQHAAPPILYGVGETSSLQKGGLAIVGSRHASEEDLEFAQRLGIICAEQKISVISGAAKGIDSQSMMAAINKGGRAIAVLAEGLGRSAVAAPYHDAILEGRLTLISPYKPESRWFAFTAMERNKLIYALADAAVVVAASDEHGGTWTGAVEVLKKGHIPIYVKAFDQVSIGNRKLLEAGCYEFPSDAFDNLNKLFNNSPRTLLLFNKGDEQKGSDNAETAIDISPETSTHVQTDPNSAKSKLEGTDDDTYKHFLAVVLDPLAEPFDQKSIAQKLNVSAAQTRKCLERAVQEGKIEKLKTRPVRYVRVSEPSLFAELQETGGEPEIVKGKGHIL